MTDEIVAQLPNGNVLFARQSGDPYYPSIRISLLVPGREEELICFAEYNSDEKEICIAAYAYDQDEPAYYEIY
jgi:hypothetical protein